MHQVHDSYRQNLLWIGHQLGVKTRPTTLESPHFCRHDDGATQCLEAPAQVRLVGFEDIPANQLSTGQRHHVALARLWLTRTTLWTLGEPFTVIDVSGVDRLTQHVAQHTKQGGTVILTIYQPLSVTENETRRIPLT